MKVNLKLLSLLALLCFACAPKTNKSASVKSSESAGFNALTTEPFWNARINITEKTIYFQAAENDIKLLFENISVSNGKFTGELEGSTISVKINQGICNDGMSDNEYPYTSEIDVFLPNHELTQTMTGCAEELGSQLLDGEWRLTGINGKFSERSEDDMPWITLSAGNMSISGYSGCNNFSGKLFSNPEKIWFPNLMMTKKACPSSTERDFMAVFSSEVGLKYSFSEDGETLFLTGEKGNLDFQKK